MCRGLTFVTEFSLFFFCLFVQPDGLLFCLQWDKPRRFLLSTASTTGFPVLGDLSVHIRTCFLIFLAPSLPCFPHPILLASLPSPIYPPHSLPDATFCCSIFSLTGDMKPLCSSCKRPCDECTDDRLLSVTASIHHKGAIVLYLFSWENCSELLTNALSYHFWLTGHYEQGM